MLFTCIILHIKLVIPDFWSDILYIPADSLKPKLISASNVLWKNRTHFGKCGNSPYWIIDYTFSEFGKYRVSHPKNKWKTRKAHTAHLYSPGTVYWEDSRSYKGTNRSCWVMFEGGELTDIEKFLSMPEGFGEFHDPEGLLGTLISEAADAFTAAEQSSFWKAQGKLSLILSVLHSSDEFENGSRSISDQTGPRTSDFVRDVEDILNSNITGKISIPEIAETLHMSSSALSHRYKKETGMTPIRKFNKLKIEQVKTYLLRGFPLKWIAEELDYSDEFHLSKMFKNIEGVSPRDYRKRI